MERELILRNNLEFIKAVVGTSIDGSDDTAKGNARKFISRINDGKIILTPAVNVTQIKSGILPDASTMCVFVPYLFSEFVGDKDPGRVVEYAVNRTIDYGDLSGVK